MAELGRLGLAAFNAMVVPATTVPIAFFVPTRSGLFFMFLVHGYFVLINHNFKHKKIQYLSIEKRFTILEKDIVTKEMIKEIATDISTYILDIEIKGNIELIDKEFTRVEKREADVVFKNGDSEIIHIEIQNQNDKTMHLRMHRYLSDILFLYPNYTIKQYVIYIGKSKCSMTSTITNDGLSYRYGIINISDLNCEAFLYHDKPEAVTLSILCNFKGKDSQVIVNTIVKRLSELCGEDEVKLRKYLKMASILSKNRNLDKALEQGVEMLSKINIEEMPFYEKGLNKGIQEGIERGTLLIAKQMLKLGLDMETIHKATNLSTEQLNELKKELDNSLKP
ncbi:MAG: Rpn family recombination-promoting nuclease/putative transposase [Epsilonproteobacteria bacterium]|nr:Rpn family recombination-promoting nuclease/putative transposase [Campylobacterota bacterium]